MNSTLLTVSILLILSHTCLCLTCWNGNSKDSSETIKVSEGSSCIRYYYCQGGWSSSDCHSFNSSIIYSNSGNNLHSREEMANIMTCKESLCNNLISPNIICHYGSGSPTLIQLKEFGKNSKYCYSQNRDGVMYYSITDDTCPQPYIKCCNTNYCNEAATSRLSVLLMFIIMVVYLERIEL